MIDLSLERLSEVEKSLVLKTILVSNRDNIPGITSILKACIVQMSDITDKTPKQLLCDLFDDAPKDEEWAERLRPQLEDMRKKVTTNG